jgi:hypothetical protein
MIHLGNTGFSMYHIDTYMPGGYKKRRLFLPVWGAEFFKNPGGREGLFLFFL